MKVLTFNFVINIDVNMKSKSFTELSGQQREAIMSHGRVVIDVGGEQFHAKREIFFNFPGTRLGKLMSLTDHQEILNLCHEFTPSDPPEFYFDRNPEIFAGLLVIHIHLVIGPLYLIVVLRNSGDVPDWTVSYS